MKKRIRLLICLVISITMCFLLTSCFGFISGLTGGLKGDGSHTTHEFSEEWTCDAENHWHECACGDKANVKAHIVGDKVKVKDIVDDEGHVIGYEEAEYCTVCGRELSREKKIFDENNKVTAEEWTEAFSLADSYTVTTNDGVIYKVDGDKQEVTQDSKKLIYDKMGGEYFRERYEYIAEKNGWTRVAVLPENAGGIIVDFTTIVDIILKDYEFDYDSFIFSEGDYVASKAIGMAKCTMSVTMRFKDKQISYMKVETEGEGREMMTFEVTDFGTTKVFIPLNIIEEDNSGKVTEDEWNEIWITANNYTLSDSDGAVYKIDGGKQEEIDDGEHVISDKDGGEYFRYYYEYDAQTGRWIKDEYSQNETDGLLDFTEFPQVILTEFEMDYDSFTYSEGVYACSAIVGMDKMPTTVIVRLENKKFVSMSIIMAGESVESLEEEYTITMTEFGTTEVDMPKEFINADRVKVTEEEWNNAFSTASNYTISADNGFVCKVDGDIQEQTHAGETIIQDKDGGERFRYYYEYDDENKRWVRGEYPQDSGKNLADYTRLKSILADYDVDYLSFSYSKGEYVFTTSLIGIYYETIIVRFENKQIVGIKIVLPGSMENPEESVFFEVYAFGTTKIEIPKDFVEEDNIGKVTEEEWESAFLALTNYTISMTNGFACKVDGDVQELVQGEQHVIESKDGGEYFRYYYEYDVENSRWIKGEYSADTAEHLADYTNFGYVFMEEYGGYDLFTYSDGKYTLVIEDNEGEIKHTVTVIFEDKKMTAITIRFEHKGESGVIEWQLIEITNIGTTKIEIPKDFVVANGQND